MRLPPDIETQIEAVTERLGVDGGPVWLFGSRANGTARDDSDWDLLVLSSGSGLAKLRAAPRLTATPVDLFVVTDGDAFVEAWPSAGEIPKHGRLSEWKWQVVSPGRATYQIIKYADKFFGKPYPVELDAFQIRPTSAGA